jgi:hypothetical protein
VSITRVELVDCPKRGEKVEKPVVDSLRARSVSVIAVLIAGVITFWSTDMFGWGKPKASLTGEWKKAEELALPWAKKNWDFKPSEVEADTRWPYMIRMDKSRYLLVHNGQVVEWRKGGVEALSGYLRDIKFLERKDIDADLLLNIIGYFDAYGPETYRSDYFRKPFRFPQELYPRVESDANGVRLILNYHRRIEMPTGVGGSRPSGFYYLARWTLTIPRDYHLAWRSENLDIKIPAGFDE